MPIKKRVKSESSDEEEYKEKPKKIKKSKEKKLYRIQLAVLFILMTITIVYLHQKLQEELNAGIILTEIKKEIKQIIKKTPLNISFTKYLDNLNEYTDKDVTLTGFLNRELLESGTAGVYVESVMDSFGNKINLSNLKKEQIDLFPKIGKTAELYNVTGKFKKKYQNLDLEVVSIVKS